MKIRKYIPFVKWAFLLALIGLAGWYAYSHPDLFSALHHVSLYAMVGLGALMLMRRTLQSTQFAMFARELGANITFPEAFGLVISGSMYSFLIPGRAGLGAQAAYLKSRHSLSLAHFGALATAANLIMFTLAAAVGLATCTAAWASGMSVPASLVIAFSCLLGMCLGGSVFVLVLIRVTDRIPWDFLRAVCRRLEDGLRTLWNNKKLLVRASLCRFGELIITVVALTIACGAVGLHAGPIAVTTMVCLGAVGMLLPLTPGGLGINEGAMTAAGAAWGLSAETVMLAALVRRAVGMSLTLALGVICSYLLVGSIGLRRESEEDIPQ